MGIGFTTNAADIQTQDSETPVENESLNSSRLAELFPELDVVQELGRGGMGVVYKARQKHLDRFVALKVLRPEHGRDPAFAERFTREARAMAKLNHPTIISVFDFGQRGDVYFLVMEFVNGANLRHIARTNPLTPEQALAMVPNICDALQFAHDAGVVHRDIKPENILIDEHGRVKIADFGLAKMLRSNPDDFTLTGTRQIMGTPHYMAPEQMERPLEVDHRADIYSLGVVVYEMLTGELPIGRFAPPSEKVQVDVRLDDVVLRALAREPERRYQQITDVKTGVEDAAQAPSFRLPVPRGGEGSRWTKIHMTCLLVAGLLTLLASFFLLMIGIFEDDDFFIGFFTHVIPGTLMTLGSWRYIRKPRTAWVVLAVVPSLFPIHIGAIIGVPLALWRIVVWVLAKPQSVKLQDQFSSRADAATADIEKRLSGIEQAMRSKFTDLREVATENAPVVRTGIGRLVYWMASQIKWFVTIPFRLPWTQLWKTMLATVVWLGVCTSLAIFASRQISEFAPSHFFVRDRSATKIEPVSDKYRNIHIRAEGSGTAYGTTPPLETYKRTDLVFYLRKKTPNVFGSHDYDDSRRLQVDLTGPAPLASQDRKLPRQYWSYFEDDKTFLDWMAAAGIDTDDAQVIQEAKNLSQVVSLVSLDGGIEGSTRPRLVRISEMINPELFSVSGDNYIDLRCDTDDYVWVLFGLSVAAVALSGLGYIGVRCVRNLRAEREERLVA